MNKDLKEQLVSFLSNAVTPFHALKLLENSLSEEKFQKVNETDEFLFKSGKYFYTKNDSLLVALNIEAPYEEGFSIFGAHLDFPALKIRPQTTKTYKNYLQIAPEIYGGPIIYSWFDRPLGLAGRITYLDPEKNLKSKLCDFKNPLAILPSLAIHLNRKVNEKFTLNRHKEVNLLFTQEGKDLKDEKNFDEYLKLIFKNELDDAQDILSYNLSFYDLDRAKPLGLKEEFLTSQALDNLISCFLGTSSFLKGKKRNSLLLLYNHEECGSLSSYGADSNILELLLKRLAKNANTYAKIASNSYFLSCDNGHATHPNYPDKHDESNISLLNSGILIKHEPNQKYITDDLSKARLIKLFKTLNIPYQNSTNRNDTPGGSTIGPVSSARSGIIGADIGLAVLGMHSIRETCGIHDIENLYKLLLGYFSEKI